MRFERLDLSAGVIYKDFSKHPKRKCPNCRKNMRRDDEITFYCEECDEAHFLEEHKCPKCKHRWTVLE